MGILRALDEVAARHGALPAQIALAWLIAKPVITAPIVSVTSLRQLGEILKAPQIRLSPEDLAVLDAAGASQPARPFAVSGQRACPADPALEAGGVPAMSAQASLARKNRRKAPRSEDRGISKDEIENVEELATPRTPVIYEVVRRLGEEEMARPLTSLWWSGVAAGLSISFSLLTQAI